jgi:hypothetical protein
MCEPPHGERFIATRQQRHGRRRRRRTPVRTASGVPTHLTPSGTAPRAPPGNFFSRRRRVPISAHRRRLPSPFRDVTHNAEPTQPRRGRPSRRARRTPGPSPGTTDFASRPGSPRALGWGPSRPGRRLRVSARPPAKRSTPGQTRAPLGDRVPRTRRSRRPRAPTTRRRRRRRRRRPAQRAASGRRYARGERVPVGGGSHRRRGAPPPRPTAGRPRARSPARSLARSFAV